MWGHLWPRAGRYRSARRFPRSQQVRELDDFEEAALDAIKGDELSCIVAKVEAEMPKSFLIDVHMLENRFEFPRWLQSKGGVN